MSMRAHVLPEPGNDASSAPPPPPFGPNAPTDCDCDCDCDCDAAGLLLLVAATSAAGDLVLNAAQLGGTSAIARRWTEQQHDT